MKKGIFWKPLSEREASLLCKRFEFRTLMLSRRIEKVNELLLHEVAALVNELVRRRGVLITLTRTDATPNLASVKVYFVVYPENKEADAQKLLNESVAKIQHALNKRLYMKHVPRIIFVPEIPDPISALFDNLKKS